MSDDTALIAVKPSIEELDQQMVNLEEAPPAEKEWWSLQIADLIRDFMKSREGMQILYERAARLDKAGLFTNKVWEDPKKLVPNLAGGTLLTPHPASTFEAMSNLRMLAYAKGEAESPHINREEALDFLEQMIVHNLNFAFREPETMDEDHQKAVFLTKLLLKEMPFGQMKDQLSEEVVNIMAQRPILIRRVKDILRLVEQNITLYPEKGGADKSLSYYLKVLNKPTNNTTVVNAYHNFLKNADSITIMKEAKLFGKHITRTGLASAYHAIFLNYAYDNNPELIIPALNLDPTGAAEFNEHQELVGQIIKAAVTPATCQSIYGLAKMLEKGILSHLSVQNALLKLIKMDMHPEVSEKIVQSHFAEGEVDANTLLIAGTLSVLGQSLGLGQGHNPTCQSVRGISLWADQAPVKLLDMIITAARTNDLEYHFEGDVIRSSYLSIGLMDKLYMNLDPVSVVLVPHLDKIYNEMMRRTQLRGEDGHKWVNPAFYGYWIPTAFMSAFSPLTLQVENYELFIRSFYASQHPSYNGGYMMVFPNPLGIIITSPYGKFYGFHAVSLLRVEKDPDGIWRAYFLNPQNEGRQNWGQGIIPSVQGKGEQAGESSLPFDQFLSRVYAFHYNSLELGEISSIPEETVNHITELAKTSWGEQYQWEL